MISVISYVLFAGMSGYLEAYFWAEYPNVSQRRAHVALTVLRLIVMGPVLYYEGWMTCVSIACMFPFIHDGVYYQTRNKINRNVYPHGWMDQSTESGALISLGLVERSVLAMIGITILALC